jgi:hypothetical protein
MGDKRDQRRVRDLRHGSRGTKPGGGGIKAHFEAKYPDKKDVMDTMTDAAVATYCPEYW